MSNQPERRPMTTVAVKIDIPRKGGASVQLNGVEISDIVRGLTVRARAGKPVTVILDLVPARVELSAEAAQAYRLPTRQVSAP